MDLGSRNKIRVEGGMASMTDLVFLLLIFFIIMSLMSNNQTPLDLPKPEEAPPTDTNPVQASVLITEDNKYVVMPGGSLDNPMEFEEIKELAAQAVLNSGELKLKVAGHKDAKYEAVFRVLAFAQVNEWDPIIAYKK
ncbi:MAG: biopolymer transporter ExbD [Crocinitomicaceae bacterium]|jgi:biopolymer transport protein ExbD|nr:biopolymer transporter ExbD [Crocinitomicaceae bacterium]